MSDAFQEDAPPADQLVSPDLVVRSVAADDDRVRLVLDSETTPAVSAVLDAATAGAVGDALARAADRGHGWTTYAAVSVDLPAAFDGRDDGTVRVEETPAGRARVEIDAGGVALASALSRTSAFSETMVLWSSDEHDRGRH